MDRPDHADTTTINTGELPRPPGPEWYALLLQFQRLVSLLLPYPRDRRSDPALSVFTDSAEALAVLRAETRVDRVRFPIPEWSGRF